MKSPRGSSCLVLLVCFLLDLVANSHAAARADRPGAWPGSMPFTRVATAVLAPPVNPDAISGCVQWSTLADHSFRRVGGACIYDPVRERIVMFGGDWWGGPFNDLWVQPLASGHGWSRLAAHGDVPPPGPAILPDPGPLDVAVYDSARDRMLLVRTGTVQVWALSLGVDPTWSLLNTTAAPAIGKFAAVYDPVRDRVLVFDAGPGLPTKTRELALATLTWSSLPDGPAIDGPRAFYDAAGDRMLLTGAAANSPVAALSLAGAPGWSTIADEGPGPLAIAMVFDDSQRRLVAYDFSEHVMQLDVTAAAPTWQPLAAPGDPGPRYGAMAVYDAPRRRMALFGGYGDFCDTWALDLTGTVQWSVLDDGQPTPRHSSVGVWDAPRQRLVVYGGDNMYQAATSDVFALDVSGAPEWSRLQPTGSAPTARTRASAVFDPVRERMIVFGGVDTNLVTRSDIWALSLAGTPAWTLLAADGAGPEARDHALVAYDPRRDRMLVYGGKDDAGPKEFHDTWAFDLTTNHWSQLAPAGTPPVTITWRGGAAYDPVGDRMLVIGGPLDVTAWSLSLAGGGTWSPLAPTGDPPLAGYGLTTVYDPLRDRVLVYGGLNYPNVARDPLVHVLDLTGALAWSTTGATSPPAARGEHVAVFDSAGDRMITFGGEAGLYTYIEHSDVQAMTVSTNTVALEPISRPSAGGSITLDPAGLCYAPGTVVTLTAVPASGYGFTGWSGDASGTTNPVTIAMDGERHVTANFAGFPVLVTATPDFAGTVAVSPNQNTYAPGATVTLTATPQPGYGFGGWEGDTTAAANPLTLTVHDTLRVTARFTGYAVSVTVDPPAGGFVVRSLDQEIYPAGYPLGLTATAHSGYAFTGWSGDASDTTNGITLVMDGPRAVTAHFVAIAAGCGGWSELAPPDSPAPRGSAGVAWDVPRERMVMFGGFGAPPDSTPRFLDDLWAFEPAVPRWTRLEPTGDVPSPRDEPLMVYDSARDRMLVIGGNGPDGYLMDVHALSLGATPDFQALATTGPPPVARFDATAVYDPVGDRVLLYGGLPENDAHPLYQLALGTLTWQALDLTPAPPNRSGHVAVYDSRRRRMLVIGGINNFYYTRSDVWALDLGDSLRWTELEPPAVLSMHPHTGGVSYATAIYDSVRDRVVLFGGADNAGASDQTWALDLAHGPAWVDLSSLEGPAPAPRVRAAGAYDPVGDELVIFGGVSPTFGDTWALEMGEGLALDVALVDRYKGRVDRSPRQACYAPGVQVTLTAVAEPGHRFTGWSGDVSDTTNPITVTVDRHLAVIAEFDQLLTPTLLEQFEATSGREGVRLVWRLGEGARATAVRVERATAAAGPWTPLALDIRTEQGAEVAVDADAAAGVGTWYRLVVTLAAGGSAALSPIQATGEARVLETALAPPMPNPSSGRTRIAFALARGGPVRVQVLDVAGRVVATLADGPRAPGRYTLTWDARRSVAGLYFVRMTTHERTQVRRVALVP